jgi:hypothetical protein
MCLYLRCVVCTLYTHTKMINEDIMGQLCTEYNLTLSEKIQLSDGQIQYKIHNKGEDINLSSLCKDVEDIFGGIVKHSNESTTEFQNYDVVIPNTCKHTRGFLYFYYFITLCLIITVCFISVHSLR